MGNRSGNPKWFQWYKGMPCLNPSGRPRGSTRFNQRMWRFCLFYATAISKPGNATEAARRAGYSRKSARFIASRLKKKPAVREILRDLRRKIEGTRKLSDGTFMIPNDKGGYDFYRKPGV